MNSSAEASLSETAGLEGIARMAAGAVEGALLTEIFERHELGLVVTSGWIRAQTSTPRYRMGYGTAADADTAPRVRLRLLYPAEMHDELARAEGTKLRFLARLRPHHVTGGANAEAVELRLELVRVLGTLRDSQVAAREEDVRQTNRAMAERFMRRSAADSIPSAAISGFVRALRTGEPLRIAVVRPGSGIFGDVAAALGDAADDVRFAPDIIADFTDPGDVARAVAQAGASDSAFAVVIRGGGADRIRDTFNAPEVLRALAGCPLPVAAAVGHESDFTEFDRLSDMHFPTPTAFGRWLAERRREVLGWRSHEAALRRELDAARSEIDALRGGGRTARGGGRGIGLFLLGLLAAGALWAILRFAHHLLPFLH